VAAIVPALLHDLVVGDRPATICGRERNPTWIESAIRARFVRDSFHNLSTGLRTGLSHHSGLVEARAAAMGNPRQRLQNACGEGMAPAPLRPSAPRSKTDGPSRGRQRCPGFCSGGQCRLPRWDPPNRTVMQALRLRQSRTFGAAPAIARAAARRGSRWAFAAAFAGPPGSMYLPRCEMHARLRARLEPIGRSPPRRAISSVILVGFTAAA
jgi:hypothetical protein